MTDPTPLAQPACAPIATLRSTRELGPMAELDALRAALVPFADFIAGTDPTWSDNRRISTLSYEFDRLTLGIFRRARDVLAAHPGQPAAPHQPTPADALSADNERLRRALNSILYSQDGCLSLEQIRMIAIDAITGVRTA